MMMTPQKKASSQTVASFAVSKGKKIVNGARVLLITLPRVPTLFFNQLRKSNHPQQSLRRGQLMSMSLSVHYRTTASDPSLPAAMTRRARGRGSSRAEKATLERDVVARVHNQLLTQIEVLQRARTRGSDEESHTHPSQPRATDTACTGGSLRRH